MSSPPKNLLAYSSVLKFERDVRDFGILGDDRFWPLAAIQVFRGRMTATDPKPPFENDEFLGDL